MKKILFAIIIGVICCSIFIPILQVMADDKDTIPEGCSYGGADQQTCSYVNSDGRAMTATYKPKGRCSLCCPQEGLVVCGTTGCACGLCDFFVLIERIIDFLLFRIAPVAAVLLIIIGGVMFLISSGNPATVTKAKNIIMSVIIGLTIMYTAYMVIGFILTQIGLSSWANDIFSSWLSGGVFEIQCDGTASNNTSGGGVDSNTAFCNSLTTKQCSVYNSGSFPDDWQTICEENPCGINKNPGRGCYVYNTPDIDPYCEGLPE
jgi:hypothetical protein